jgi:plastocyanin
MRPRTAIATATALALLFAGCGSGQTDGQADGQTGGGAANVSVAPGAREIRVKARSYAFAPEHLDVQAGERVAIVLHSQDQRHDFAVEGMGVVVTVDGGKTASGGLRLRKAGSYTFYCSIAGHRAAGMEGTITAS